MESEFSSPEPTIVLGRGFSVEQLGRTGLRYTEESKVMFVDSEGLGNPHAIALYTDSINRWEPPDDGDAVGPADRVRIVDNIRAALRFAGYDTEIL